MNSAQSLPFLPSIMPGHVPHVIELRKDKRMGTSKWSFFSTKKKIATFNFYSQINEGNKTYLMVKNRS